MSNSDNIDDQKFEVDIDGVYQGFISQINSIRSYVDVSKFNSIKSAAECLVDVNTSDEDKPQESRCNAFYRLLGLPVFDGQNLYSPGMDLDSNSDSSVISKRTNIANNICKNKDLISLLNKRESVPKNFYKIFSSQDAKASVLAMSSVKVRSFFLPFSDSQKKDTFRYDFSVETQTHKVDEYREMASHILPINGSSDTTISEMGSDFNSRPHIIRPMITDPRADLSVIPAKNRMAAPFVADRSKTQIVKDVYLKRPYIEKVIRDRLSNSIPLSAMGDTANGILNTVSSSKYASGKIFKDIASSNKQSSVEMVQIANFINMIRSVLNKLYMSLHDIYPVAPWIPNNSAHAFYNWVPSVSESGPEGGCKTSSLLDHRFSQSNTTIDNVIIKLQMEKDIDDLLSLNTEDKGVDIGGFAFDSSSFLMNDIASPKAYKNHMISQLEKAKKERNSYTEKANIGLRYIEIIMGEFSGLGLCDILAISMALWSIDKKHLLQLIDIESAKRLKNIAKINKNMSESDIDERISNDSSAYTVASVDAFNKEVLKIYLYMSTLYEEISTLNKR